MRRVYVSPELEILKLSLQGEILALSTPENTIPEEGGDLPRDGDDLFN